MQLSRRLCIPLVYLDLLEAFTALQGLFKSFAGATGVFERAYELVKRSVRFSCWRGKGIA